jgi:hypothetical protein
VIDGLTLFGGKISMRKIDKLRVVLLAGLCSVSAAYANPGATVNANSTVAAPKAATVAPTIVPTKVVYDKYDLEIRVGGRAKADFNYDVNGKQAGSTYGLDPASMPLNRWDYDAMRHHNFNASLTASRISLDVKHQYGCIESYGYLETDFNGGISSGVRTTNNYLPRIRHAYGELSDTGKVNSWLVDQTWTNFATPDVNPFSANNTWPSFRTAQVRYTRKFAHDFSFSLAAERPNTQTYYYSRTAAGALGPLAGSVDNDTSGGFNKSAMPDFTFNAKYQKETTLLALRGVVRRLEVKTIQSGTGGLGQSSARDNFFSKKTGWGLGASAMFRIAPPVAVMFQVQGGDGIGRYIDYLGNGGAFDSYFQYPSNLGASPVQSRFETVKAINFIGGFTINWRDNLETNIGAAYTKVSLPKNIALTNIAAAATAATNTPLINTRLQRYHANLVYTIVPKTFAAFEVEQYYRNAGFPVTYKAKDTQLVFSFIRNF